MIFKENNKAIFLQIADRVADDVLFGTLHPDDRIPSVRAFAAEIEVNANTVMRAYEYLTTQGVIYNKRGIGYFISPDAPSTVERLRRAELDRGSLDEIFRQLMMLDVSADDLARMYRNYLDKHNNK